MMDSIVKNQHLLHYRTIRTISEKLVFVYFSENLQIFIVAITQKLITCEGYERYIEPRQHVAKVCTNVLFVYV